MPRTSRSRPAEAATSDQPITAFARISKSQVVPDASAKKTAITNEATTSSKKRKASSSLSKHDGNVPGLKRRISSYESTTESETDEASTKRTCRRPEPSHGSIVVAIPAPKQERSLTPAEVVTKGKRVAKNTSSRSKTVSKPSDSTIISLLRKQNRESHSKHDAVHKSRSKKTRESIQQHDSASELPAHLAELVQLNKSFLKTVMLQFAHSGNNAPLDFRTLAPHIARSWGKRQVTIEDIRRCIAIQSSSANNVASPFIISDYGRGKVCVELEANQDVVSVNEERLCRQFEANLRRLCEERAVDEMTDVDISLGTLSLQELPQAAITNMDRGFAANPQLAKGHRALTELKNGIVNKHQERFAKQEASVDSPMLNADGSKISLLDRLRLKALAKAEGPLPPTGPELQRRAALNRVADVSATISMLSLSNPLSLPRQAFAMAAIQEKLKDSLRVPVSREEGAVCVRLIATEVAPEWLRIVTIGGRDNVVVQRNMQPVDKVIQERVQKLLS